MGSDAVQCTAWTQGGELWVGATPHCALFTAAARAHAHQAKPIGCTATSLSASLQSRLPGSQTSSLPSIIAGRLPGSQTSSPPALAGGPPPAQTSAAAGASGRPRPPRQPSAQARTQKTRAHNDKTPHALERFLTSAALLVLPNAVLCRTAPMRNKRGPRLN